MTWQVSDGQDLVVEIGTHPLTVVLFGLDDCTACGKAIEALNDFDFAPYRCRPLLVVFREMCPADSRAMRDLRVDVFPQMRLYAGRRLLGAWQGLEPSASHKDIRRFTRAWLARTIVRALEARREAANVG